LLTLRSGVSHGPLSLLCPTLHPSKDAEGVRNGRQHQYRLDAEIVLLVASGVRSLRVRSDVNRYVRFGQSSHVSLLELWVARSSGDRKSDEEYAKSWNRSMGRRPGDQSHSAWHSSQLIRELGLDAQMNLQFAGGPVQPRCRLV
jgi:hypothetical protein